MTARVSTADRLRLASRAEVEIQRYAHDHALWHKHVHGVSLDPMQVLKEQGRRVPDDVAVVGFDDAPMAELTDPPLTSVHQPAERMGREMVRLLFEQIDDGAAAGASTVLSTELIRRDSS